MDLKQEKLEEILRKYKAQPVGNGYIDVIVNRDYYKDFIAESIFNDFEINAISWWEYTKEISDRKFGMGGPKSWFFDGWFAEICTKDSYEEFNIMEYTSRKERIDTILEKIHSKVFKYFDGNISFLKNEELIPAFWFNVPDSWINQYIGT
ncbi:hypothetical protein LPTSP4_36960 [Leptospira ryugenii]|uniref:Uncharacterized protein n=1 Tax=Leptospira ryugenii TaxID=1917863 RepID=A0A2P2E5K7_9LEPT|nr:hypothetical protein [Leptospira ryugenii]GBF52157.1 hypothetical protein LPTSP4_36960 [Leptospira ryugenii]